MRGNDDNVVRSDIRRLMIDNGRMGVKKIAKTLGLSPSTVVRHYMKIKRELSENGGA